MFDWLKKHFEKENPATTPKTKPVILTIHGYGRRRKHEFDNLALWGKKKMDMISSSLICMIYLMKKIMIGCAGYNVQKDQLDQYKKTNRDIYLVGFSMGGVIASYLAAMVPVKKLVLLAPAFSYINMDMITDAITKSAISLWTNDKKEEIQLPRSFYSAFSELIKNPKKYITKVDCPILFLHGDEDEVISIKSSINAYDKVPHERKKLIILHEGHHRLLMDEKVNWEAYQIMKLFFDDHLLNEQKIEMAEDIMDKLIEKKHRLDAEKENLKQVTIHEESVTS
ncbi:MAG: alpha/beta hydrolase [Longicatena caecimuris]|uniref:alpha/beta hydrolase n=1 Tax=Longicatena caecimuris TaxID=1796635 RepID=UPI00399249CA